MTLNIAMISALFPAVTFSPVAEANGTCRVVVSSAAQQALTNYCNTRADVTRPDPNAEKGEPGWIPYFFENPDECDLGISFPDLIPDINIDLKKINSCEILKAVSKNAVNKVNEKFSEIESDVNGATGGDVDVTVDVNDKVNDRIKP